MKNALITTVCLFVALGVAFGQRTILRDGTKRTLERSDVSEPVMGTLPGVACTTVTQIDCDGPGVLIEFPEPVHWVMAGWTGGGSMTCFTASGMGLDAYAPTEQYYVGSVNMTGHTGNPRIVECVFEGGTFTILDVGR